MANPILGLNPIQILTPHKSPTGVHEHPALKSPPKSEDDILRELRNLGAGIKRRRPRKSKRQRRKTTRHKHHRKTKRRRRRKSRRRH